MADEGSCTTTVEMRDSVGMTLVGGFKNHFGGVRLIVNVKESSRRVVGGAIFVEIRSRDHT